MVNESKTELLLEYQKLMLEQYEIQDAALSTAKACAEEMDRLTLEAKEDGLSVKDLAQSLGVVPEATHIRLRRAKGRLKNDDG